jgi:3-hydroxyacyl-[acyl-carrier-protein] dehydratase
MIDIEKLLPHRPPFLLLDEIIELTDDKIVAQTLLRADDELWSRVYAGHYPGNPITPGVLLCEMVFQAAGVLVASRLKDTAIKGVPILTKIENARFKAMVKPGDTVEISANWGEQLSNAFYMAGAVKVNGKNALRVSFTVALAEAE